MKRTLTLIILSLQTACATWQPVVPGSETLPDRVRVTTTSGTVEIRDPVIEADSVLMGTVVLAGNEEPVRLPLTGLLLMEERRVNSFRTFVLVYAAVGMLLGVLLRGA